MEPIQMRNLTAFPIERLCFDLKLEVLEQLDAKGVIELVKVNQGFEWMILSRPTIVFGHHVHTIKFGFEQIYIKKLNWKSLKVNLDVICHFPFIKNIRSCNQLWMYEHYNNLCDKDRAAFRKAVNSIDWHDPLRERLELLSHLSIKVKRYATLPSFLPKASSIKDLAGHFIETQLNKCEGVRFECEDDDHFYYNALIKTHIRCVILYSYDENLIFRLIRCIVSHGIPSENPAAVVGLGLKDFEDLEVWMETELVVYLKEYPGMKQINEKNRRPFIALANDRWKGIKNSAFSIKDLCFRRNINSTRDCIYICSSRWRSFTHFSAFYIKPDEMIDH